MNKLIKSEWKKAQGLIKLQGKMGFYVRTKESLMVGSTIDAGVLPFTIDASPDRKITCLGVGGSSTDMTIMSQKLSEIEIHVALKFSRRDITVDILKDFISKHIRTTFYDSEDETPLAMEFILIEFAINYEQDSEDENKTTASGSFSGFAINTEGDFESIMNEQIFIIGDRNSPHRDKLMKTNWEKMTTEEAQKRAEEIVGVQLFWLPPYLFVSKEDEPAE